MENDIDLKLYNEYLNGNKAAFETIYNKYKNKIEYFVYNIVKDKQKAEDITQEVFIYILKNKIRENCNFKYYIFLIAKSRAFNYINLEKRRTEINETYILQENEKVEQDTLEIITKHETKKEILEAINMLDDKYRNAMFLVKIEELSYKEVAEILGETVQNINNLIYRGKKELRKILIKKGFDEMNKVSKLLIVLICVTVALSGVVYASMKIYERMAGKANMIPVFTGKMGDTDYNSIWVGTFNLVWNELMDQFVKGNVKFEGGNTDLVNELNKQLFKKDQLSEKDYYIKVGKTSPRLKEEILKDINNKFNINGSDLLKNLNFNSNTKKDFTIYAMLYKNFKFPNPFDKLENDKFGKDENNVKYFGINNASKEFLNSNIRILFYNNEKDFAVKLRTKENEEVILYRTNENKSFNNYYEDIKNKSENYTGRTEFGANDELKVPYINVDATINYDELCGKEIKNTNGMFIKTAMQNVKFNLNETGGNITSESLVMGTYNSYIENATPIYFEFDDTFVLFMKEADHEQPYMSLKVDNIDILELATEK